MEQVLVLSLDSVVEDVLQQQGTRLSDRDLASRKAEEACKNLTPMYPLLEAFTDDHLLHGDNGNSMACSSILGSQWFLWMIIRSVMKTLARQHFHISCHAFLFSLRMSSCSLEKVWSSWVAEEDHWSCWGQRSACRAIRRGIQDRVTERDNPLQCAQQGSARGRAEGIPSLTSQF